VIAAGKAAWPMATAMSRRMEMRGAQGLVAGPSFAGEALADGLEWFAAGHPNPNAASVEAGRRALELARSAGRDRLVLVLLSGGASALLAAPAPGITLDDKLETARLLMEAGVAIDGLNCVRKHLSLIKGGRLGAEASHSLTLAISDVHGPVPDDPSVIGSGPTVADPSTYRDALDIVRGAAGMVPHRAGVPRAVLDHLEQGARGQWPETVKPGDPRLAHADFRIIANRLTAMAGARRAAERLGYTVAVLPEATQGDARAAAQAFFAEALRLRQGASGPFCALASGETTVRVTGRGRGGRNQEFALTMAPLIDGRVPPVVAASVGTDGIDGPTDAAGAIVDPSTLERARHVGRDWQAILADNDAYSFFAPLGDLVQWGPTGTNVGDLHVLLTP
jgi:glycerate 2-kinase